jgi:ABC-type branched-subunit amino acid transport system substrate-binding protein
MSSRERPGFDNAIAEIIAAELGAQARFVWTNFDEIGIRDTLQAGLCDVAIGVAESVENILTTVPYLSTPFVFATRADADHAIESLDDPRLRELRIGTYQSALPSIALRNRGIVENVREFAAVVRPTGLDGHTPILDGLLAGEIDIAIVYGPMAGARSLDEGGAFILRQVQPEIDFGASIIQLSRIWTIGVRAHDQALRDRLNRVLAERWDDVAAAIDGFGVPRLPLSRPRDFVTDPDAIRIGVIHSARTPASLPNGAVGDDARLGLQLARNLAALALNAETAPSLLLEAHAPTLEAVERAAERLIRVERVEAIVGGFDEQEANLLARIAREHGVVYLNVGSEDDALRDGTCHPTTLHVAASGRMLVEAMLATLPETARSIYVIAERGTDTEALLHFAAERASAFGVTLSGSALVEPGQFVYFPTLQAARATGAAALLLLMGPDAQEMLLGQLAMAGVSAEVAGLATIRGQSRNYLQRYLQVAPREGGMGRVSVWDPALDLPLNDTFVARTGTTMEPAAWTTFAAVASLLEARRMGARGTTAILAALTQGATWDVGKGEMVAFRAADGQLLQPLYQVSADPAGRWGRTAAERTSIARVTASLAADTTAVAITAGACATP